MQLLTRHRCPHLRCLELSVMFEYEECFCPQTDAALLPLVQPADVVVAGRAQRQAARAAKRDKLQTDESGERRQHISANNAANFPALECLALPYASYNSGENAKNEPGVVSGWTIQQLRRSYEYELAAEWEAECVTLGEAELLKSILYR